MIGWSTNGAYLCGTPDPQIGMVLEIGAIEQRKANVQKTLDYKFLNDRRAWLFDPGNVSRFIFERV